MWKQSKISSCQTHHTVEGNPLYTGRFTGVQKFHEPGLAPVFDRSGAYHIEEKGSEAYSFRFEKVYGFYCQRAAVEDGSGAYHITPSGTAAYRERYRWCGNFQSDLSTVRTKDGKYFHIDLEGKRVYQEEYLYAGDYRDGCAVVCLGPKRYTHIDTSGERVHGAVFEDLDVYHKGYARARDAGGWFHIDVRGKEAYANRYALVEPFYNEGALVEKFDGAREVIDPRGDLVTTLTPPTQNFVHALSADMVSFWKCETLFAAAELGIFSHLPGREEAIAAKIGLTPSKGARLLRALWELELVFPEGEEWDLTEKGKVFALPWFQAAAVMWKEVDRRCWPHLLETLRDPIEAHHPTFKDKETAEEKRALYHRALDGYAIEEFGTLSLDLGNCQSLAATGRGSLPLVEWVATHHPEVACRYFSSSDWVEADALLLVKFLHYWPDSEAKIILHRAKEAAKKKIFLIEFSLSENHPGGSLLDLNMAVESGGKERTPEAVIALLESAGLKVHETKKVGWGSTLFEVRK